MTHYKIYNPNRDNILHHDSPEDFLKYINTLPEQFRVWSNSNSGFYGEDRATALRLFEFGDDRNIPAAEKLIDQMRTEGILSHGQKVFETSVVGSFPCVAHAVMGLPDTMYQMVESDIVSNTAPLKIIVDTNASARVTAKQLTNRGIAIMGLVMALIQIRPVNLYMSSIFDIKSNGEAHGNLVRLQIAPMDLSRNGFMLCNPAYHRQLTWGPSCYLAGLKNKGGSIPFPWSSYGTTDPKSPYTIGIREAYDMQSDDLLIPGTSGVDIAAFQDPIKWIKEQLQRHMGALN